VELSDGIEQLHDWLLATRRLSVPAPAIEEAMQ
jgi:hypothetical protein